jgi:hypothetical protein
MAFMLDMTDSDDSFFFLTTISLKYLCRINAFHFHLPQFLSGSFVAVLSIKIKDEINLRGSDGIHS